MMSFAADPPKLRSHAEYLSDLSRRISDIADESEGCSFGVDSFGLVGQAFSSEARQVSEQAAQKIKDFSERTEALAEGVAECAEEYEGNDLKNSSDLSKIEW